MKVVINSKAENIVKSNAWYKKYIGVEFEVTSAFLPEYYEVVLNWNDPLCRELTDGTAYAIPKECCTVVKDDKTLSGTKWMIHSISSDLLVRNPANNTLMFTLDEAQTYIRDSAMNPICYDLIEVTGNIIKINIDFRSV